MNNSRELGGAAIVVGALAVGVIVIILIAAGAVAYIWQRQNALAEAAAVEARQTAELQQEVARRALAYAQQQQAEAKVVEEVETSDMESETPETPQAAVLRILETQQQAWNQGDIDRFMQHYWKSEDLSFSSGGKVTRGWDATLENYKQRYPSRDDMGQLDFGNLEIKALGAGAAMVMGDWQLTRKSDDVGGNFTLIVRRLDGEWVIVHDHTSRLIEP